MKNSKTLSFLTLAMLMLQAADPAASKPENADNTKNKPSKVRQGSTPRRPPQVTNLPQAWQTLKTAKQLSSTAGRRSSNTLDGINQAFLAAAPLAGSHRGEIDKLINRRAARPENSMAPAFSMPLITRPVLPPSRNWQIQRKKSPTEAAAKSCMRPWEPLLRIF
ncbi:MAG: hypothetical protein HC888_05620 [Candidatus Competibacteraceae bacterium]|nr:hypothetical protein [Candidatus Competibacteraceae bacterium]